MGQKCVHLESILEKNDIIVSQTEHMQEHAEVLAIHERSSVC